MFSWILMAFDEKLIANFSSEKVARQGTPLFLTNFGEEVYVTIQSDKEFNVCNLCVIFVRNFVCNFVCVILCNLHLII
jgi:hypothetical protein